MKKSQTISVEEEQELFDRGLVIRRAWIMPDQQWEYYVNKVGDLHDSIAIRSTHRAAYNAGLEWLEQQK